MPTNENEPFTPTPEASSGSLLVLLRLTVKWKRLVRATVFAVVILTTSIALLLPNRYTSTVVILPPQQSGSTSAAMLAQLGSLGSMASAASGLGIKNSADQQVAFLKSETVENAIVARFHLQDLYHLEYLSLTRKRLEKFSSVEVGLKDGLIRLSVTDRDPRRAADIANGWVEEYQRFTATLAITEASQRRLFFERELKTAREDLVHAEEEMQQTEQRTGVIDISGQSRSMIASAAALRGQLAAKQIEIRAMREFATDQNPELMRAQQEMKGIEAQLSAMDATNNNRTGDLSAPRGAITQAGLDYTRTLREVKYRETILELMARQYELARVDEARQGALVQVVDPGRIPDRHSSPHRSLIFLGALLAAWPLSLLVALAAEIVAIIRSRRRRTGSWANALEEVLNEGLR